MQAKDVTLSLPGLRSLTFLGYDHGHAHQDLVPEQESHYRHRKDFIREYRSWHNDPGEYGFAVVGPTGSGKSTGIIALNALLNIPTIVVQCDRDTGSELKSTMQFVADPESGQTVSKIVLGSVARAFKHGFTVILEEAMYMDPGVLGGLNETVRGKTMVIEASGEVIKRHPMFRLVLVGNDWGRGDGPLRLAGLQQQNAAFLNRFWKFGMGYPDATSEAEIIRAKVPSLPDRVVDLMVEVASRLREVIVGVAADTSRATLDVDFSTRTLLLWAEATRRMNGAPHPVQYGLEIACLRSCEAQEKEIIERCCRDVMGDAYDGGAEAGS
jgi:cobaltochelatase CobS